MRMSDKDSNVRWRPLLFYGVHFVLALLLYIVLLKLMGSEKIVLVFAMTVCLYPLIGVILSLLMRKMMRRRG